MAESRDLIGNNFVTRYVQGDPYRPETNRAMLPMKSPGFTQGHIDLGAVLVSAVALRESSIRFDPANGELSDWKLFESIMQRPGTKGSAFNEELQYIHQLQYSEETLKKPMDATQTSHQKER